MWSWNELVKLQLFAKKKKYTSRNDKIVMYAPHKIISTYLRTCTYVPTYIIYLLTVNMYTVLWTRSFRLDQGEKTFIKSSQSHDHHVPALCSSATSMDFYSIFFYAKDLWEKWRESKGRKQKGKRASKPSREREICLMQINMTFSFISLFKIVYSMFSFHSFQ